ncbi:MAG: dihydrofolate reductase family protein [Rhizobiaceae bacterium]|nr:dihydrofolate reductase family protein [Rhizobiaceae bacterium]
MAILRMQMMGSLDGYVNDAQGNFDWHDMDRGVHEHSHAEGHRDSLAIYGRRMYETMLFWETYDGDAPLYAKFARYWRGVEKLVVSSSLAKVSSANTILLKSLDIEAMRRLKAERSDVMSVSGPTLGARFLDAGLVDEIGIYTAPVIVGGGTPMLQSKRFIRTERVESIPFGNGVTFARYRVLND